jgi:hypothetical protein
MAGSGQAVTTACPLRQLALAESVLSAYDFLRRLRGGPEFIAVMKNGQNLESGSYELVELPSLFFGFLPKPLKFFFHREVELRINLSLFRESIFTH